MYDFDILMLLDKMVLVAQKFLEANLVSFNYFTTFKLKCNNNLSSNLQYNTYIKSKLHEYILYKEKVNLLKHSRLLAPFAKIVIHFSANCKRSAFSISYHKFVEYNIKKEILMFNNDQYFI